MTDKDQITRHEREIGELRGKLDSLATKEFVREVVREQTEEMNRRFDAIASDLQSLKNKQDRMTGAANFLRAALPMLISVVTLIVPIISLLLRA